MINLCNLFLKYIVKKSDKMGKNPKFGPTENGWLTKEDGLKSKNARKQTHIKIQFYNRKKVTSFNFWTFWPSAPISLSPNIHLWYRAHTSHLIQSNKVVSNVIIIFFYLWADDIDCNIVFLLDDLHIHFYQCGTAWERYGL